MYAKQVPSKFDWWTHPALEQAFGPHRLDCHHTPRLIPFRYKRVMGKLEVHTHDYDSAQAAPCLGMYLIINVQKHIPIVLFVK